MAADPAEEQERVVAWRHRGCSAGRGILNSTKAMEGLATCRRGKQLQRQIFSLSIKLSKIGSGGERTEHSERVVPSESRRASPSAAIARRHPQEPRCGLAPPRASQEKESVCNIFQSHHIGRLLEQLLARSRKRSQHQRRHGSLIS